MRSLICLTLISMVAAIAAAPVETDEPSVALVEVGIDIPDQTISGWYARGDAETEVADLEVFLKALSWGAGNEEQMEAEGRSIEVDLDSARVLVRDTAENVERIGHQIDPGIGAMLRERILNRTSHSQQVTTGSYTLDPEAGADLMRPLPPRVEESSGTATGGSATVRRTLRLDGSMHWRDLRLTLINVFGDDPDRLQAVLLADTSAVSRELQIAERRSVFVDNYRIRLIDADADPDERVDVEVTDLLAQLR